MNDPEPALQTPAVSPVDDGRVFTISKPSPKIVMAPARDAAAAAAQSKDRNSFAVTAFADLTDRSLHAAVARFTAGLSPAALAQAYLDWATHLANAPGKRMQLVDKAMRKGVRLANYARPLRHGGRRRRVLHRAAAAGPALRRRGLAAVALQLHPPGVPAQSAMVAQRDHRHSRRHPSSTKTWSNSCRARSST